MSNGLLKLALPVCSRRSPEEEPESCLENLLPNCSVCCSKSLIMRAGGTDLLDPFHDMDPTNTLLSAAFPFETALDSQLGFSPASSPGEGTTSG
jgi:hypothetical protein